jgi:FkbM family methyltransferase
MKTRQLQLSPETPEYARVLMTVSCEDSDSIPKVPCAGQITSDAGHDIQLMHNGVKVVRGGYYGDWMAEIIRALEGHHEPQEERVFHEVMQLIPERATMLELGGFWGYYSLWFQSNHPERTNYVVEPDPKNIQVGQANFRLNGMQAQFIQGFAGRYSMPAVPFACESDGQTRLLPQVGVDDFITEQGLDFLDVLHADCQGAELSVLESAQKSIRAGKIRFIFLSTHHHSISGDPLTHQRCLRCMRETGANIIAEHTISESFSGDGLIVAAMLPEDRALPQVPVSHNRASASLFPEVEYDLAEAFRANRILTTSLSWKLTAPLRKLDSALKRASRRPLPRTR